MAKKLTCWELLQKIRKQLGSKHSKSPFVLPYLEKRGWVEQKKPYTYTLCEGIQPTPDDINQIVDELKRAK